MFPMKEIEAAVFQKMKISGGPSEKQTEGVQGVRRDVPVDGGHREHIIRWFVDTQATLLQCDGNFPPWFHGFISRQDAEDHLRDMSVGCFLIRLSDKGIGYVLSYNIFCIFGPLGKHSYNLKLGQDRCRHFVINQTRTGLFVVSGDSTTHNSLTELIDHFKTTPIQPFGECLTSYNTEDDSVEQDPQNDIYDVVQSKPSVKPGVSVKALKSLWEQTSDVPHETAPTLSSKSSRKLTASTFTDKNSLSQVMRIPTMPRKYAPLRNSLSAGFAGMQRSRDQQSLPEPKTSGRTKAEKVCESTRRDSPQVMGIPTLPRKYAPLQNSLSAGFAGTHHCRDQPSLPEPRTSGRTKAEKVCDSTRRDSWNTEDCDSPSKCPENSCTNRSLPLQDENIEEPQSLTFDTCNPMPSTPPLPPTASCTYALLDFEKPHTEDDQAGLRPNLLYQSVSTGKKVQSESKYDNRTSPIYKTLPAENTYQVIPDQCHVDTYEPIAEIHDNNTYEDIPATDSNTYASLEEIQPHTKKNQKWWKLRPESKK